MDVGSGRLGTRTPGEQSQIFQDDPRSEEGQPSRRPQTKGAVSQQIGVRNHRERPAMSLDIQGESSGGFERDDNHLGPGRSNRFVNLRHLHEVRLAWQSGKVPEENEDRGLRLAKF